MSMDKSIASVGSRSRIGSAGSILSIGSVISMLSLFSTFFVLRAFTFQGVKVVRRLREPNGTEERV